MRRASCLVGAILLIGGASTAAGDESAWQLARQALARGDFVRAERLGTEAVRSSSENLDVHALLALAQLESGRDIAWVERRLERVLASSPRHPMALFVDAKLRLAAGDFPGAITRCEVALAGRPDYAAARALLALALTLSGDARRGQALSRTLERSEAGRREVLRTIVLGLVEHHHLGAAREILLRLKLRRPRDAKVLAALGEVESRLGQEREARQLLRQATRLDPSQQDMRDRSFMLETIEDHAMLVTPVAKIRVRFPRQHASWLALIIPPFLDQAARELAARYGEVSRPIEIQLGERIRSAGETLGFLGEAAGGRIVAALPDGGFHWGMLLWHELAHVYAMAHTGTRAPRWLLEGLAENETERHDPSWRRHAKALLAYRLAREGKPSLDRLEQRLAYRSDDWSSVTLLEAAELVKFIERRRGFAAIRRGLDLLGRGRTIDDVLPEMSGLDREGLEAAFHAELERKLSPQFGAWLAPSWTIDCVSLEEDLRANPDDGALQARYALIVSSRSSACAHEGEGGALAALARAKRLAPESVDTLVADFSWALVANRPWAEEPLSEKERDETAHAIAREIARRAGASADAHFIVGELDPLATPAERLAELGEAARLNPDDWELHVHLGYRLRGQGREDDGMLELTAAARLGGAEGGQLIGRLLIPRAMQAQHWREVRELARLRTWTMPCEQATRLADARAALALGEAKDAVAGLELALACSPAVPTEAQALLDEAKRALEKDAPSAR